jgi:hypothetical protein
MTVNEHMLNPVSLILCIDYSAQFVPYWVMSGDIINCGGNKYKGML